MHHPKLAARYHEQNEQTSPNQGLPRIPQRPICFHGPTLAARWALVLIDKLCPAIGLTNDFALDDWDRRHPCRRVPRATVIETAGRDAGAPSRRKVFDFATGRSPA
jgi:hypothetical protein